MTRIRVHSTNLAAVGYDGEKKELEILFNSGALYKYYDVPPIIHEELMKAHSHGRYFHEKISRKYNYVRVG